MARDTSNWVKLYSPYGTEVEVKEGRAEVLKGRGYTTSKPRNVSRAKGRKAADNSAELESANAEIERLRAELEAAQSGGQQFPDPQQ